MAAPIGHQRRAIEVLIRELTNGAGKITWPLGMGPESGFFEGGDWRSPLFLLGISERDTHTPPELKHCVAVFGASSEGHRRRPIHVRDHFCAMGSQHSCASAMKLRRATPEEARLAGVDEKTAKTVELLQLDEARGQVLRFVLTGDKATYAGVY